MQRIKQALIIASLSSLMLSALPAAAMTDMDGKPVKMDGLGSKGKWTVVEIWASDCQMCKETIRNILDFEASNPEVKVLGISVDGAGGEEAANGFIEEQGLTFPNMLSDPPEIAQYLQDKLQTSFIGTPTVMVYNPQGKLVTAQPGGATADELATFIKTTPVTKPPQEKAKPEAAPIKNLKPTHHGQPAAKKPHTPKDAKDTSKHAKTTHPAKNSKAEPHAKKDSKTGKPTKKPETKHHPKQDE